MEEVREPSIAAWYLWSMESQRKEWRAKHPRSRYYFVTYSRYPHSRAWLLDLLKDAAKTAVFRYGIGTRSFFMLLYQMPAKKRYGGMELRAAFKIEMYEQGDPRGDIEVKSASFFGDDAKLANYEWRYGSLSLQDAATASPCS